MSGRPGVDGRQTTSRAANGHPVEIMDLSFSVQAMGCHMLAKGNLAPGVHPFPAELDREIATAKLKSCGIFLDPMDAAQQDTLHGVLDLSQSGDSDV